MERANTPSLYSLVSTYWQRMDDYSVASERTEQATDGTPDYAAAFIIQSAAGERLSDAERAIAGFIPRTRSEAKVKSDFLKQLAADNYGRLEKDVTTALLSSLPALIHWKEPT